MSVKAKLSLVIGVLSLFILILAVRDLMGNMERVNALDLVEQIDEVSIKLLKAQGSSAVERGTTNGFLGNPAAAKDATISTAKAKRGEAKQALQDAMDLIRRYGFTESSAVRSALGVVETSQSTVDGLRTAADGAFASRSLDGTGDLSSVWFGTTSAAIVDMHKLQQSIEALIPKVASTKIVDTFVVRVATWEMSEHSGRIRGFFAKLISQGAPLNPQAALIQGQNNGHVETGWDTVQGYYPIMPPRIQRAIESIETVFFGEYEPVRKSIILAATSGQPYPMESSEWFAAATKGIAAVLAAQVEISEGLKDLIHEDRNAATTDVFISAVILVAALIIAGFSMFVVFGRIAQPLSHMTEVLSALADGEADVHLADNSGNDEIGKMSRAVHALRGTVVDAFQKGQMLEQLSANVMMASLPDFEITYVNAASKRLLERIEDYLPVPANQVAGQSIDIFHKNPGHVQSLLRDPGNLPYTTRIAIGPEHIQLSLSPIRDRKG
ncbi:MAG: HAMP domain-containing protein, partial [Rhodospirillaceae bacterium]